MTRYSVEEVHSPLPDDLVDVLAAAYMKNPLHLAVFPASHEDRMDENRRLFRMVTAGMLKGTWLGVRAHGNLVGLLHYAPSPLCSPPAEAQRHLGAMMTETLGEAGARAAEWFMTWSQNHPDTGHWHLGPFAVAPEHQGQGIGKLLMKEYCRRMDKAGAVGYLETELRRLVSLYEGFQFRVIKTIEVIGVQNWLMERART